VNQTAINRSLALVGTGFFSLPIVLYMGQNIRWCVMGMFKLGWYSRPFISISPSGIIAYVAYTTAVSIVLTWAWRRFRDPFIGLFAMASWYLLAVYGLGFLTKSFGVLQ